ncbi:MAG: NAD(P)H-dependent oxidoreductase subunit E, partial [Oligoflexia bacterium]|nr:NAD(P)H-dependent oxidoreductase subunit E [Oligoflexia bacterium]
NENVISFKMPIVGSLVSRGLPLAFIKGKKEDQVIHSPVSGRIVEVNKKINKDSLHLLWEDPCGEGELVKIKADNLENDLREAKVRKVILAISDKQRLNEKRQQLTKLGLKVFVLKDINILTNTISLMSFENAVIFIDTLSYAAEGANAVRRLNEEFPNVKVVVLADADSRWEEKYRSQKILYYAVKPFADKEILDILFNAFVSKKGKIESYANINKDSKILPQWINKLAVTTNEKNNLGHKPVDFDEIVSKGLAQKIFSQMIDSDLKVTSSAHKSHCSCTNKECLEEKNLTDTEKVNRLFKKLDEFLIEYKQKPGGLIPALQVAQGLFGYLPKHVIKHIASAFKKSYSEVAGVVSFYSFFSTVPRGKYLVRVCLGTACYVRGGKQLVDEFQKQLKIEVGQTTEDKVFSLDIARCFGACGLAPVITINDEVHQRVKTSQISAILKQYRQKEDILEDQQFDKQNANDNVVEIRGE